MTQTLSIALLNPSRTCGMGGGAGANSAPCHVFAYNGKNTRESVFQKLDFNYEYAFYPIKLSPFGKKKGSSELPKFHKGRTEPSGAKSFFLLFCFAISKTKFGQAADVIV